MQYCNKTLQLELRRPHGVKDQLLQRSRIVQALTACCEMMTSISIRVFATGRDVCAHHRSLRWRQERRKMHWLLEARPVPSVWYLAAQKRRDDAAPAAKRHAYGAATRRSRAKPRNPRSSDASGIYSRCACCCRPGGLPAGAAAGTAPTHAGRAEREDVGAARAHAAAAEPKSVARPPRLDAQSSRTPRVTPPKTAITSHAALAAKRARRLAAGDATPAARHEPAPAPAPPKAVDTRRAARPRRRQGARAVTPDEGSHQRRDLRAVVYDAEKKRCCGRRPKVCNRCRTGKHSPWRGRRATCAPSRRASGETCWTAGRARSRRPRPPAPPRRTRRRRVRRCIDARDGGVAVASPAASSEYSEAFETDDEGAAVDDAEVGASCFFDDVRNHGVAEARRHLALDGGMEEIAAAHRAREISLREGARLRP